MHASTVVTRTPAGNAELANPAHGLSLAQRRFLTLLDTACSVDELAARQRSDASKVERDLARLASLGLVVCAKPAANDDDALGADNDACIAAANDDEALGADNDAAIAASNGAQAANDARATRVSVRLGPRAASWLPYVLVALGAVAMGLVAWRFLASSPAPLPPRDAAPRQVTQPPAAAVAPARRLVPMTQFDRAVRKALSHGRFEPGTAGRTTTVDVAFKRD